MAKILIVDDSLVMRKNLSVILKGDGHEIVGEATNGRQAVTMYRDLKPDLVTMDISMPILTGVEAVKKIIEEDANAKIIMISAVNQKKMVFNALNSGAKHYIVKPIEPKKVIAVIDEVIQSISDKANAVAVQESSVQGFAIENIDGAFVITFNEHLGMKDHNLLDMAIRGIMFIKPLRVRMDFSVFNVYEPSIMDPIMDLAQSIKDIDGSVSYKTSDDAYLKRLEAW